MWGTTYISLYNTGQILYIIFVTYSYQQHCILYFYQCSSTLRRYMIVLPSTTNSIPTFSVYNYMWYGKHILTISKLGCDIGTFWNLPSRNCKECWDWGPQRSVPCVKLSGWTISLCTQFDYRIAFAFFVLHYNSLMEIPRPWWPTSRI